ncbi:MAG: hypothetical protein GWO40_15635, partial [Gammaproteobacteria bacterium]|nr:hypothetical protein [Gammaproteobacteria bacterium]NIV52827.1 hypothetical protein [Gammaproteobacteria bacterium]NIX86964.1 hypothetical protein [Gammaproteobacteria bacterium]
YFDQDGKNDEKHRQAFLDALDVYKQHFKLRDERYPEGHTFQAEIANYHRALARACALATGGISSPDDLARGTRIAAGISRVLLDGVILPYNQNLGQRKKHDTLYGYYRETRVVFDRLVEAAPETLIGPQHRPAVAYVFDSLFAKMEAGRKSTRERWKDS